MIRTTLRRSKWWLLLPILLLAYGTVGFLVVTDWSWQKCFYMTVVTLSTVGFDDGGLGEDGYFFITTLILFGVGAFAFVITHNLQEFIEQANFTERRIRKRVHRMHDHFIICGAGRIGLEMAERLREKKETFVVVDSDPEVTERLKNLDIDYIQGDATEEETLVEAGIHSARGLAAVLHTDADNLFATLTARELNPTVYIVARANSVSATHKLLRAGANKSLNPFTSTAARLMHTLIKPTVTDFLEIASRSDMLDLAIEEILIPEGSALADCKIADSRLRQEENVIAAAIQKKDGRMVFNPGPLEVIEAGDVLIALGSQDSLEALTRRVVD